MELELFLMAVFTGCRPLVVFRMAAFTGFMGHILTESRDFPTGWRGMAFRTILESILV